MKFKVSMKCPDALNDAIFEAVAQRIAEMGLEDPDSALSMDSQIDKTRELCRRWFAYGECLVVEVDTDAMTCCVIEH